MVSLITAHIAGAFDVMAEDDMEIISENGRDHGLDDDNMRDIPLDTNDDDQMFLEVLAQDTELVDADMHPSPQVGHDDFMLEDDNQEEIYHVHDATMEEHTEQDTEPQISAELGPVDGAASFTMVEDDHSVTATIEGQIGTFNEDDFRGVSPNHTALEESHYLQGAGEDEDGRNDGREFGASNNLENSNLVEEQLVSQDAQQSSGPSEQNLEEKDIDFAVSQPKTASEPAPDLNLLSQVDVHDEQTAVVEVPVDLETASNETELSPRLQGLLVLYQHTEYSLFGSSTDDPDSFFLTDTTIADKPISDFFHEIRNVIHEDIAEEEELCVSINHFGLEIEETVCSLHDVTISQLLDLHEQFLKNEERSIISPLRINLTTRPSFARRLANLSAGAADGKKLYELVSAEEYDSQQNNSEGAEEGHDYPESNVEELIGDRFDGEYPFEDEENHASNAGEEEEFNNVNEVDFPDEDTGPQGSFEDLAGHLLDDEDAQSEEEDFGVEIDTTTQPADHEYQEQTDGSCEADPAHFLAHEVQNEDEQQLYPVDGLDEDGDLIDYSEDEHGTDEAPTKAAIKTAQNEAINDELRRRSLSRAPESKEHTPPLSNALSADLEHVGPEVTTLQPSQPEVSDNVDATDSGATVSSEQVVDEPDDDDYLDLSPVEIEEADEEGVNDPTKNAVNNHSNTEGNTDDLALEVRHDTEGEVDDDQNHTRQDDGLAVPEDENPDEWPNTKFDDNESHIEHLVHDENAGSSATLSVGEGPNETELLPGQNVLEPEVLDFFEGKDENEIDYDEDDFSQAINTTEPNRLPTFPATSGGPGKRSRRDSNDSLTLDDIDTKRVKS